MRLKYVMVDGQELVFESTWGLQEREYDHDFDPFRKCPASAKKVLESAQETLKNNFNAGLFAGI